MRWKIKQIVQPLKGKLAKNINKGLKNKWVSRKRSLGKTKRVVGKTVQ